MMKTSLSVLFMCSLIGVFGQSVNFPLDRYRYHQLDRQDVLSEDSGSFHFSTVRPYQREDVIPRIAQQKDGQLQKEGAYFLENSWELSDDATAGNSSRKALFNYLYRKKSDAIHVLEEDFQFHVSPVVYFSYGRESAGDANPFINTRGVEVRGMIDDKVGFYSFIAENQAIFPEYVDNAIFSNSAVPHENFWKKFKEDGVDFFTARGYISFNATRHINVQFGQDRHFIGNGYRSLILSDFAGNYTFLKASTEIGRFSYTNLFADMTAHVLTSNAGVPLGSDLFPQKFVSLHHLNIALHKNFHLGFFESIVFNRWDDSTGTGGGYVLGYFNPVIFYRAVEQNLGSQDNALIGVDFKWNIKNRLSIYGQLVLDEFKLSEYRDNNGWWANKYGLQLGGKYMNAFGVKRLDLQGELNVVRPYTYTHDEVYNGYTHYNQPLAHPLGANFTELIGIARYNPTERLFLTGKLMLFRQGLDSSGTNFGANLFLSNTTREQEYGNEIGQGVEVTTVYGSLTIGYEIRHNVFLELMQVIRNADSPVAAFNTSTAQTMLSLRWNIPQRLHEF